MRSLWVGTSMMMTVTLMGQGDFPFPTSDAIWKNRSDLYSTVPPIEQIGQIWTSYCMQGADTLINGYPYAVLDDCEGTYVAAIRDSLGKVMIVPADSTSEYLLYDMTIPAGVVDTLEIWLAWYGVMEVVVQGLGPVGPEGRNVIDTWGYQWIEGIGCTSGLLMEPWINVSGYYLVLDCMSHLDSILYPNFQVGACVPYNHIEERMEVEMTLFPNPARDVLHITPSGFFERFEVRDVAGRVAITGRTERDDIPVTDLVPGTYVLCGSTRDGRRVWRGFSVVR